MPSAIRPAAPRHRRCAGARGATASTRRAATHPPPPPPPPPPGGLDALSPDQSLFAGDFVRSSDGRFTFTYQGDGNLALDQGGVGAIWSSGTAGLPVGRAIMQADGNLVIYDGSGAPVGHTSTYGNSGAYLKVQSDGNVVVYSAGGGALWYTGTCCR